MKSEPNDDGPCTIVISPEDRAALDRAVTFARRLAGADESDPRTPESDGRMVMDLVRYWHEARLDMMRISGY